jgi:hypothetical protein
MYNKITNPYTGRKLSIHGRKGQRILKNYINQFQGGANNDIYNPPSLRELTTKAIPRDDFERLPVCPLRHKIIEGRPEISLDDMKKIKLRNLKIRKGLPQFHLFGVTTGLEESRRYIKELVNKWFVHKMKYLLNLGHIRQLLKFFRICYYNFEVPIPYDEYTEAYALFAILKEISIEEWSLPEISSKRQRLLDILELIVEKDKDCVINYHLMIIETHSCREFYISAINHEINTNPDIQIGDWCYIYPHLYNSPIYGLGRISASKRKHEEYGIPLSKIIITNKGRNPGGNMPEWIQKKLRQQNTLRYDKEPHWERSDKYILKSGSDTLLIHS